jgi:hypothetical protein
VGIVEVELRLRVREQKTLNTTALDGFQMSETVGHVFWLITYDSINQNIPDKNR